MKNLVVAAEKLSRNPLGIIALLLVFIYAIAGLCFSFGLNKIPPGPLWAFVIFIVGFPLIVLGVFHNLVTKHHFKLYAPKDFPQPGDFSSLIYSGQGWKPIDKKGAQ